MRWLLLIIATPVLVVSFLTVLGAFLMPSHLSASFQQPDTKNQVIQAARRHRRARRRHT